MVHFSRVGSAMVTSSSWTGKSRTSFFIVRILVWNRSELTLRSVGFNNILLPVHCCGQGCHVALSTFAKGSFIPVAMVLLVVLGKMLVLLVRPFLTIEPGMRRHVWRRTRPLGGGRCGYLSGSSPNSSKLFCIWDCLYYVLLHLPASASYRSTPGKLQSDKM